MRDIYADHAATTPLYPEVFEAMRPWLVTQFANPAALYKSGVASHTAVERARRNVADILGCPPECVFFTSGASESNTWALFSYAREGSQIVTTPIEHHSVLRSCEALTVRGSRVRYLKVDSFGHVDERDLKAALERPTALVSIQHANNEIGTIQDIASLAVLCRTSGIPFHTDAAQTAGVLDLPSGSVDVITASAHKFGGPKGIGFLYARKPSELRPLIYGGSQQSGLRAGTEPVALIVGLAEALKLTCLRRATLTEKKRALAADFRRVLKEGAPNVRFHEAADCLPGFVSAGIPGRRAQNLTYRMDMAGVAVSPGAACDNTGEMQPSHVLSALGGDAAEDAECTLRITFGDANNMNDGCEAAKRLINILNSTQ